MRLKLMEVLEQGESCNSSHIQGCPLCWSTGCRCDLLGPRLLLYVVNRWSSLSESNVDCKDQSERKHERSFMMVGIRSEFLQVIYDLVSQCVLVFASLSDIHLILIEWFELGYSLFGDKQDCPITFLAGDVFSPSFLPLPPSRSQLPSSASSVPPLDSLVSLKALHHQVRVISTFSFFHLFEEDGQRELATKLAGLLSSMKGSIIFGRHRGGETMGSVARENGPCGETRFVYVF